MVFSKKASVIYRKSRSYRNVSVNVSFNVRESQAFLKKSIWVNEKDNILYV